MKNRKTILSIISFLSISIILLLLFSSSLINAQEEKIEVKTVTENLENEEDLAFNSFTTSPEQDILIKKKNELEKIFKNLKTKFFSDNLQYSWKPSHPSCVQDTPISSPSSSSPDSFFQEALDIQKEQDDLLNWFDTVGRVDVEDIKKTLAITNFYNEKYLEKRIKKASKSSNNTIDDEDKEVEYEYVPKPLRGIVALRNIQAGEEILIVPLHLLLSTLIATHEDASPFIAPLVQSLIQSGRLKPSEPISEISIMSLFLLFESYYSEKGRTYLLPPSKDGKYPALDTPSVFSPYFRSSLKNNDNSNNKLSEADINALIWEDNLGDKISKFNKTNQDPFYNISPVALSLVEETRKILDHRYKNIIKPIAESNREVFKESDMYSYERFRKIVSIQESRQFNLSINIGGGPHMLSIIPFLDMFNHRPGVTHWYFDSEDNMVHLLATKHINRCEQIFTSYGFNENLKSLQGYGFATKDNLFDSVRLFISPEGIIRKDLTKEHRNLLFQIINPSDVSIHKFGLHNSLLIASRLLTIPEGPEFNEQVEKIAKNGYAFNSPFHVISWEHEKNSLEFLKKICELSLESFSTTIEEDEKNLLEPMIASRRSMLLFSFGQKEILKHTIESLDHLLERIKTRFGGRYPEEIGNETSLQERLKREYELSFGLLAITNRLNQMNQIYDVCVNATKIGMNSIVPTCIETLGQLGNDIVLDMRVVTRFAAQTTNIQILKGLVAIKTILKQHSMLARQDLDPNFVKTFDLRKNIRFHFSDYMALDTLGQTPYSFKHYPSTLSLAVIKNSTEMVKILLELGADPNAEVLDTNTAVHVACFHGYPEIIKLLIEKGGDIEKEARLPASAIDPNKPMFEQDKVRTCETYAIELNYPEVLKLVQEEKIKIKERKEKEAKTAKQKPKTKQEDKNKPNEEEKENISLEKRIEMIKDRIASIGTIPFAAIIFLFSVFIFIMKKVSRLGSNDKDENENSNSKQIKNKKSKISTAAEKSTIKTKKD